jgi:hypothetical protein
LTPAAQTVILRARRHRRRFSLPAAVVAGPSICRRRLSTAGKPVAARTQYTPSQDSLAAPVAVPVDHAPYRKSQESSYMATIHLIGGEKGGVGKSVVSRLLAQYMIDREKPFIGFDTDRSHGALMRFYSDFASPTVVDSYQSLDAIIEVATEQPELDVLVDLAAQTHQPLSRWLEEPACWSWPRNWISASATGT